jgi:hypothetical protein
MTVEYERDFVTRQYHMQVVRALVSERDRYRQALVKVSARVMTFGGFQRTPRGEFWVSRDDVLRAIEEEFAAAAPSDSEAHPTAARSGEKGPRP